MPNHAEQLQQAKDAELRAGEDYFHSLGSQHGQQRASKLKWLVRCISERLTLLAATCPKCGGSKIVGNPRYVYGGPNEPLSVPCPANCIEGRKRDEA